MTLSTTVNVKIYTGDNSTVAFSFPYLFYSNSHLKVYLDGVLQVAGYTVTGAENPAGGTVTFSSAPATDVEIIILRNVPFTQETDLENFDGNPADVTEKQFDLLVMQTQQLSEQVARSILAPIANPFDSNTIIGNIDETTRVLTVTTAGAAVSDFSILSESIDTVLTTLAANDFLQYDGSVWVNRAEPVTDGFKASGAGGVVLKNSSGTTVATIGASNGTDVTLAGTLKGDTIQTTGSSGVVFKNSGGTTVATLGSANTTNVSIAGALVVGGKLTTVASASGGAGFNVPAGSAPSSPSDGDVWATTSGLFARINGVSQNLQNIVVQRVYAESASATSGTAQIPLDDTVPTSSEGLAAVSATITPTDAANRLRVIVQVNGSFSTTNSCMVMSLLRDSTCVQVSTSNLNNESSVTVTTITAVYEVVAGSTSPTTFAARVAGALSSTVYLNSTSSGRKFGGAWKHTMVIEEIKP